MAMKLIATRKHLAEMFGCEARWISKHLRALGITHRGAITPLDLEMLKNKIGDPTTYKTFAAQIQKNSSV